VVLLSPTPGMLSPSPLPPSLLLLSTSSSSTSYAPTTNTHTQTHAHTQTNTNTILPPPQHPASTIPPLPLPTEFPASSYDSHMIPPPQPQSLHYTTTTTTTTNNNNNTDGMMMWDTDDEHTAPSSLGNTTDNNNHHHNNHNNEPPNHPSMVIPIRRFTARFMESTQRFMMTTQALTGGGSGNHNNNHNHAVHLNYRKDSEEYDIMAGGRNHQEEENDNPAATQWRSVRGRPATTTTTTATTTSFIAGYLQKLGRNGKWQTRWFETNGEYLSYYKSSQRIKLLATLDLQKVTCGCWFVTMCVSLVCFCSHNHISTRNSRNRIFGET
jgi:hypothetical protein